MDAGEGVARCLCVRLRLRKAEPERAGERWQVLPTDRPRRANSSPDAVWGHVFPRKGDCARLLVGREEKRRTGDGKGDVNEEEEVGAYSLLEGFIGEPEACARGRRCDWLIDRG